MIRKEKHGKYYRTLVLESQHLTKRIRENRKLGKRLFEKQPFCPFL